MNLPIIVCEDCGACCQHMGHPPFGTREDGTYGWAPEWQLLPGWLQDELVEYLDAQAEGDDGKACIWLTEDGSCRHYQYRPSTCREFEVGGEGCVRLRTELARMEF